MPFEIRHFVETNFYLRKDRSTHSISIISMIEIYEFDVAKHYFIVRCVRTMQYYRQACHNNKIVKVNCSTVPVVKWVLLCNYIW